MKYPSKNVPIMLTAKVGHGHRDGSLAARAAAAARARVPAAPPINTAASSRRSCPSMRSFRPNADHRQITACGKRALVNWRSTMTVALARSHSRPPKAPRQWKDARRGEDKLVRVHRSRTENSRIDLEWHTPPATPPFAGAISSWRFGSHLPGGHHRRFQLSTAIQLVKLSGVAPAKSRAAWRGGCGDSWNVRAPRRAIGAAHPGPRRNRRI